MADKRSVILMHREKLSTCIREEKEKEGGIREKKRNKATLGYGSTSSSQMYLYN